MYNPQRKLKGNQEWTIHETLHNKNEDQQNKNTQALKTKATSNTDLTKTTVSEPGCSRIYHQQKIRH